MLAVDPPSGPPATVLDGVTIANDKDFVTALVTTENFRFNACRLAFKFLYGRPEYTCEAEVFDRCVDRFTTEKTIKSALIAIVEHASFCQ